MVNYVDFDHSIQVAAWVAIVISFHLLLCKSNLVPNSVAEFKAAQQLQQHDIHFHHGMVLVNIKSKMRRIGNRVTMPLLKGKGPACPVSALKKLSLLVTASPSEPLFAFHRAKAYSQSRLSLLTYSSLMLDLHCWLEWAGYDAYRYSCHSLHQGSTSHAFEKTLLQTLLSTWEIGGVNVTSNIWKTILPSGCLQWGPHCYNICIHLYCCYCLTTSSSPVITHFAVS